MEWIRQNRSLVEILLYRHFQRHGGLVLPPLAPALEAMRQYEQAVQDARDEFARRNPGQDLHPDNYPRMVFPIWRQMSSAPNSPKSPLGPGSPFTPPGKGKGKGGPNHGQMGGFNPFGAPGDRRPPGSGGAGGGGASDGGIML